MKVEIKILNKEFYSANVSGAWGYKLPSYTTSGSAALDLICTEDVIIYPGEVKAIHTGLAIHIGSHVHECQTVAALILPRSGLGTKGLVLANTVGLIDEDYQGELIVQVLNRNTEESIITNLILNGSEDVKQFALGLRPSVELKVGDRFAQLLFIPVIKVQWNVVEEFSSKTVRDEGGFGHTGV